MDGVGVAVGAEFLQLHAARGVATVLHGRVAGHAVGTLIRIRAALSALKCDDDSNALALGHSLKRSPGWTVCCR